ncbi:fecR family protein [Novosphingobium sp. Rr 2-17]|uniref:FecR family protein n=1 Tax=Novosphingobium sp. Rr 2-17 TaxID=555793 RepID=UPI000269AB94|nr:FecR domain-containing protein [Novosphingobium sp. Rr 2-17]EIZ78303.1 fecR family protein [Novosphingobium sp. Rr 2-17]
MSTANEIEDKAAYWLLRREEDDWSEQDQAALDRWLDDEMAHKAAFWRLEHGWQAADRIRFTSSSPIAGGSPRFAWLRGWRGAAAASALAASLVLAAFVPQLHEPERRAQGAQFTTGPETRETIPLVDGSKVQLNTGTRLRAFLDPNLREVWLDKGEAYFEVAHRGGRPFIVHAGRQKVTVLGTKFAVRRDSDKITVSVVEGRVRLSDAKATSTDRGVVITAGDVALARSPSILLTTQSVQRVQEALAWREGFLRFDQTTLSEAAAEFNRYNRRQIAIADDRTGRIRIGGAFRADNVEDFVRLLGDAYGLKVDEDADTIRLSSAE